jgi:hypothetical protein
VLDAMMRDQTKTTSQELSGIDELNQDTRYFDF